MISRKPRLRNSTSTSASHSKVASRTGSSGRASCAEVGSAAKSTSSATSSALYRLRPRGRLFLAWSVSVRTGWTLAANGEKAEQVGEREGEATRARVDPEAEVAGQIDRDARQTRVSLRRVSQIALGRDPVHAEAREGVDAEDGSTPAVQRDPVLAAELGGVLAVADLDDLRAEQ